ncbi:hypothetical protein Dret_1353 [Desulfohalobium retbaense DSM 5692]|uniref:Uncharacterized protein n=1 Tax=Desulfohalobium retbaense (strain ATCC 49708 / DSM 5692 / JCM 16813 / HR100) TaxID=485915 RepID=C8X2J4_DESRD|nr:hypothetical protein Dret_1353 [Desulfohalobium retbaense DSM 5692]
MLCREMFPGFLIGSLFQEAKFWGNSVQTRWPGAGNRGTCATKAEAAMRSIPRLQRISFFRNKHIFRYVIESFPMYILRWKVGQGCVELTGVVFTCALQVNTGKQGLVFTSVVFWVPIAPSVLKGLSRQVGAQTTIPARFSNRKWSRPCNRFLQRVWGACFLHGGLLVFVSIRLAPRGFCGHADGQYRRCVQHNWRELER